MRAVTWALPSPNGTEIAYAGRNDDRHFGFFVTDMKNGEDVDCLSIESGLEGVFTWDPDGRSLIVSKARYGSDRTLTHDLYRLGRGGGLDRITSDGNLSDPTYAPDRSAIIAVQTIEGRGNLVRVDPNSGTITPITTFTQDIQLYTPRYSPDGSTVAFSIFDVDGARAIGTIDLDLLRDSGRLDLRRLVRDSSNNRYPVWSPDGRSILYTSHFAGVPNLRRVDVASGAITQVTGVTDGLFATGWIPSSQSAIALAIEAPGDITPWRVSTKARSGERPVTPAERDPWQDITFDLTVPSVDAIKPATIIDEGSYESISGIAPILPIFPFLQNDIPTGNFEQFPYRIGAISQWWDPMQKHQILGYADYGLSSGTVGFDLFYVNNTLPISIATHVDQSLALQGVLPGNAATPDVLYYQKASGGDVTLALWLPALDALDIFHEIRLKLAATTRRAEGRDGDVARAQELFGTEHTVSTIGLGYTWTTPKFWFDAGYEKGLGLLEGDFEYDKLEAHISGQLPLIYPFRLIGTVHAVAQNGRQLPYDFVGLNRYNLLSTDVGLSLRTLTDYTIRIRGVNAWVFGNRAYTATGGLELGFDWIGPLRGSGLGLMVWAEQGSAWFSTDEDLAGFDPQEAFAWGVELRAPYLEKMHLALGLASARLDDVDFDLAFFTRVGWGF